MRGRAGGIAAAQAMTPQERRDRAVKAARAAHSTDALIKRLGTRNLTPDQVSVLKRIAREAS